MTEKQKNAKTLKSLKTRREGTLLKIEWALDAFKTELLRLHMAPVFCLAQDGAEEFTDAVKALNVSAKRLAGLAKRARSLSRKIEEREANELVEMFNSKMENLRKENK